MGETHGISGMTVGLSYVCGGCGTAYRSEALVGNEGNVTQLEREMIR